VNHKYRVWSWLLVLALVVASLGFAFWLDTFVHSWVLEHKNRSAEVFMRNVSRFGDWPEHVALGLILAGLAWWRGNKNWTRVFLSMLIACAIAGAAARVIKITTGRARPSVKTEEVWNGPRLSEKFHAFPSGHMAASTAFWAILLFASWRIGLACLPIPLVIGASRMYVAAHYLSDVVFAGMLGLLVAYLVARFMFRQIRNPRSAVRI
jgi:membrane-associated phospholipid phosphatase